MTDSKAQKIRVSSAMSYSENNSDKVTRIETSVAPSRLMDDKELQKRSLMSGTSAERIKRALQTHDPDVGPGQYNVNKPLFG